MWSRRSLRQRQTASASSCPASSAAVMGCRRRISIPPWRRPCSTNWPSRTRGTASPSASTTTSLIPAFHSIRNGRSSPTTLCARSSTVWAPTALWAPTRTASRSSPKTRVSTRRAISSTIRTNRARRRSRICVSGLARSDAPYLVGSANFVGCHQFHFLQRQDIVRLAAPARRFSSTRPTGPIPFGISCHAPCRNRSSRRS